MITDEDELRRAAARAAGVAEGRTLQQFGDDEIAGLRRMLFAIIGDTEDKGSCR